MPECLGNTVGLDAALLSSTILIVDDMPENLAVLGDLLRASGYEVKAANNGVAALRYAAQDPIPALILLDVMMPEMDGYEVLRRLGADETTQDIPVIFLTALSDPDEVARGLRHGAADYIPKPIQPEVVLARVHNQIDAYRARRWLREQNRVLEVEVSRRVEENLAVRQKSERIQAALNRQRELILIAAGEGIVGVSMEGTVNFVNPAAASMLGYGDEDLIGRPLSEILRGAAPASAAGESVEMVWRCSIEVRRRELNILRKDGGTLVLALSCMPIIEDGVTKGAVVTFEDVGDRKRYLEQLEHKSNYDDITGLPNRNLLNDRLAQAIVRCRKSANQLAALTLNLDRFKSINDSLGHDAGDTVLNAVAQRLTEEGLGIDTVARLDGDEFVLVVESASGEETAHLAQSLLSRLTPPFVTLAHEFFLTGSIGIAIYPKDGEDGGTLLKNSTAAVYRAKAAGGNRFHFYAADMNARSLERLDMENGLRRALDRSELVVHYQPQVSLRTGEIIGAEALVRWQHPERGLVMPNEFIGLAEDCGLIVPLGEWVLATACAQNKAWQDAGLPPVTVAVNMSARQFAAQDVVRLAASVIEHTGLDPLYLELELAESAVMADAEAFIRATEQLKGLAITLSIDDFGTGFSSLNYLKRFAIDRLKIDQSFVRDVTHDANSAAIALAVISLAHSLKLSAIAEGVETEAQLAFLRRRDCDEMQGFYFSRPVPADEFERLLRERRRLEFTTSAPLPSRTLLLVDDEPGILASLKRLFRREGYQILTAESGLAALELLASQEVGVIVSDARMPGMSGGEFLGKVRELYPDVIRMMLSGYTDLKAVTSAVNRGELFCFLTKPWDDQELLETVRDAFHHYEQRRQARGGA